MLRGKPVMITRHMIRRSIVRTPLIAVAASALASAAFAQHDRGFAVLDPAIGTYEPWQLTMDGDGYHMVNATEDDSLRFSWVTSPTRSLGSRTITTSVEINDPSGSSHAGLLYALEQNDDGSSYYYMFVVRPDHRATLYRRDADGAAAVSSVQSDLITDGNNELSIEEDGDQVSFFVNGTLVALIGGVNNLGGGNVGVVAWGVGNYLFTDFDIQPEQEPPAGSGSPPASTPPPPASGGKAPASAPASPPPPPAKG
jgi:hypothetical protein